MAGPETGQVPQSAEANRDQKTELPEVRTAESAGQERARAAGEWLTNRWEGVKDKVGKAGGFLKRFGFAMLGADVAVANVGSEAVAKGKEGLNFAVEKTKQGAQAAGEAAQAVGRAAVEKGQEGYKFVSEKTKEGARVAGEKMQAAYGRVAETTERIYEGAKNRIDAVCEKGRNFRDGIIQKMKDAALREQVMEMMAERDKVVRSNESADSLIARATAIREANKTALERINAKLEELTGVKTAAA